MEDENEETFAINIPLEIELSEDGPIAWWVSACLDSMIPDIVDGTTGGTITVESMTLTILAIAYIEDRARRENKIPLITLSGATYKKPSAIDWKERLESFKASCKEED